MKTLTSRRPRNPFTALALARRAGSHRPGERSRRQDGQRELRAELSHSARWRSP